MATKRFNLKEVAHPFSINIIMGFAFGGFAAMLPLVRDEFNLTSTQVGFYTTSVFLASFATALFAGYFIDRLGTRKGLAVGGLVMGGFFAMYGVVPSYQLLLVLAFGAGLGQSLITPAGNKAILASVGSNASNTVMGFFRSGVGVGSLLGASILPAIGMVFGWRMSVFLAGALCFFLGLSVLKNRSLRNRDEIEEREKEKNEKSSFKEDIKELLRNRHFRFLVVTGFTFGAVMSTTIGYMSIWLNEVGGLSLYYAGLGLGLAQFGGVLGRPFWGLLVDRFQIIRQDMILALEGFMMIIIILIFALVGGKLPGELLMGLAFILGFAGMGFGGIFFGYLGSLAGYLKTGVATGLALTFLRLSVVATPPFFGWIADSTGSFAWAWGIISVFPMISVAYFIKIKLTSEKPVFDS